MNFELKPCPFCGSVHLSVLDYESRYRVECNFCKARTGIWDSKAEAIEEWNRRIEPTFTPDELDAIRRNVRDWRAERELSKIEQSIIDKCNAALKGTGNE